MENGVLPKIFLDFLNIRHFPSVPKTESCGWVETAGFLWTKTNLWLFFFFFFLASVGEFATGGPCGLTCCFFFFSLEGRSIQNRRNRGEFWFLLQSIFILTGWELRSLFALHLNLTLYVSDTAYVFFHPVNSYAACSRPQTFSLLLFGLFSVNFHTSQSCCFWETRTCCHLHMVSSGYLLFMVN